MIEKHLTNSEKETKEIAQDLAQRIISVRKQKTAVVLALIGDLGGGKTTFLQGFARGLGVKAKILSPTFVILKKFRIPGGDFSFFYHIDCYRIKKAEEIAELGFEKIIADSGNVVAVEWADRIEKMLPASALSIRFKFVSDNKREIEIRWPKKKNA